MGRAGLMMDWQSRKKVKKSDKRILRSFQIRELRVYARELRVYARSAMQMTEHAVTLFWSAA